MNHQGETPLIVLKPNYLYETAELKIHESIMPEIDKILNP